MSTAPLFTFPLAPPPGLLVVAYGGGVNTVAELVLLARHSIRPHAIVMSDPGDEWPETLRYRDDVMVPWLAARGWPSVTTISRASEGALRPRVREDRLETLREECLRIGALPSIAYGWKKCSLKYKAQPARWWLARQPWAIDEWNVGRRIVKAIGYDAGEPGRVRAAFQDPWEDKRLVPWYPLHQANLDRDECEALIADEGLPPAPKSSCTYCPNMGLDEWRTLRATQPEAFARAVEMSRNAAPNIDNPDVVGLMRCNPHGKRQLHVWVDEGDEYLAAGRRSTETTMPCECAF